MTKTSIAPEALRANLASEKASRSHLSVAVSLCITAGVFAIGLLPFAKDAGPVVPGFILINQTALLIAYALSAWVLFRQFGRSGSVSICLLAGDALYTTGIIFLQLLSFPGVVAGGRVLGSGPETTTWLWTFWHLGPPSCALAYGLTMGGGKPVSVSNGGMFNRFSFDRTSRQIDRSSTFTPLWPRSIYRGYRIK